MLEVVVLIEVTLDLVSELDAASVPPDDVAGVSDAALLAQAGDAPVGSIGNMFTLLAGDLQNLRVESWSCAASLSRGRTGRILTGLVPVTH
jgi:hypothetical protein